MITHSDSEPNGKAEKSRRGLAGIFTVLGWMVWIWYLGLYWAMNPELTQMQVFQTHLTKVIGGAALQLVSIAIRYDWRPGLRYPRTRQAGPEAAPGYIIRRRGSQVRRPRADR